ncbi:MAG TPA: heparinase II/III family protein [Chloroflexota bacterium]|nr:heparinase II/III family protein [Chloroflexota bacterium]
MTATRDKQTQTESPRSLLRYLFPPERIESHLLSREAWHPFPRRQDREGWAQLPRDLQERTVSQAKAHLGASWPDLPATLFLEFRRNGNRSRYEAQHFARRTKLTQLVLGECVEAKGRFLDDIVNGVWALCEESFWGVPAHSYSPSYPETGLPDTAYRVVDLFAAETAALLAWTHYLLGEQLARELPVLPDRITREVQERLLTPYQSVDDWRWLGKARRPVNNWNPWIHSNVLAANLLLESDGALRLQTVQRVVQWLDVFLDGYHDDGGCDEGPSYWGRAGASLFDCLEWLHSATNGALDAYDSPLVQEIGRYIYRAHIAGPWYVNFADASAKASPDGNLIYRYGKRIGDPKMMAHGAYVHQQGLGESGARTSIGRALPALLVEEEVRRAEASPPLIRDSWLDGIQVLTAREREGSAEGLFLAAKGGHNAESHNHNDVGSFVVALDGHPVLIDVGVETYTKKTFGAERYEIWTMQSLFHNLPAVNGQGQRAGREHAARDVSAGITADHTALALDIAPAYPSELAIQHWRRTIRLDRTPTPKVIVEEDFALTSRPESLALHLMTSGPVALDESGILSCSSPGRPLLVRFDPQSFRAHVEPISIEDARLEPIWGDRVYRVTLEAQQPTSRGHWTLTMEAGPPRA